jgi:hypothetical protein
VAEGITQAVFLQVWRNPGVVVGHEGYLGEHLVRMAFIRAAYWRADHPTERPTLPVPPMPKGDGAAA